MTTRRLPYVEPWTTDRVAARLRECATTLRIAPTSGGGFSGRVTYWPTVVAEKAKAWEIAPAKPSSHEPGLQAQADQIDRMDATLQWISVHLSVHACRAAGLIEDSAAVVWGRANNWSYARIGKMRKMRYGEETRKGGPSMSIPGGNARPSLVKIERSALKHLATILNRTAEPVDHDARIAPAERVQPKKVIGVIRAIAPERGPPQYDHLEDEDRPVHARTRSTR